MANRSVFRRTVPGLTLWVMALALVLRALLPAGIMPDAGALRDGRIEMTFCTADGSRLPFELDLTLPDKSGHDQTAPADCPFGILAAQAIIAPPAGLSAVPVLRPYLVVPDRIVPRALPPLPAQGPPLGSRAPPSRLG